MLLLVLVAVHYGIATELVSCHFPTTKTAGTNPGLAILASTRLEHPSEPLARPMQQVSTRLQHLSEPVHTGCLLMLLMLVLLMLLVMLLQLLQQQLGSLLLVSRCFC